MPGRWGRNIALGMAVLSGLVLAACDIAPVEVPVTPQPRPAAAPAAAVPAQRSAASRSLEAYYSRVQSTLLAQGLLRTGGGGVDTPYTDTDLMRNFERLAFYDEYRRSAGLAPPDGVAGRLKKWTTPVRMKVEFGPLVPAADRSRDLAVITAYLARLERITGHPMSLVDSNPNFLVLIMGEDAKQLSLQKAQTVIPNLSSANRRFFLDLPRRVQCFVLSAGNIDREYEINRAVSVIRAENTDLQRLACVHEELAQGLGLTNDSPQARPSIFNDDDEFALLTTHDEQLLRILYNPRLRPGMSLEEARPIIRTLISGPGGSI